MTNDGRLLECLAAMTRLAEAGPADESRLLAGAAALMEALVAHDDWPRHPRSHRRWPSAMRRCK